MLQHFIRRDSYLKIVKEQPYFSIRQREQNVKTYIITSDKDNYSDNRFSAQYYMYTEDDQVSTITGRMDRCGLRYKQYNMTNYSYFRNRLSLYIRNK